MSGQTWLDPAIKERLKEHRAKLQADRGGAATSYSDTVEHLLNAYEELARHLAQERTS